MPSSSFALRSRTASPASTRFPLMPASIRRFCGLASRENAVSARTTCNTTKFHIFSSYGLTVFCFLKIAAVVDFKIAVAAEFILGELICHDFAYFLLGIAASFDQSLLPDFFIRINIPQFITNFIIFFSSIKSAASTKTYSVPAFSAAAMAF